MPTGTRNQPSGRFAPNAVYLALVDQAFAELAGTAPTVLWATDDDRLFEATDFPESWPTQEVASSSELPAAVTELLGDGPVLMFPPWGRRDDVHGAISRYQQELVLLECTPSNSGSLLAVVLPASSMASSSSERFREELAHTWRPVLLQYSHGALDGVHRSFLAATVFLRPRADGVSSPLRMFEYSASDDDAAVIEDFNRLFARRGGRGKFGYVLWDTPELGETLSFARHDPKLKARRDSLTAFGDAATIDDLFETPSITIHTVADRALRCAEDEPGAARIIGGRDIKRDGTIGLPDERTEYARGPEDRLLQIGDVLIRTITMQGSNLVVAQVAGEDLPAVADQAVIVLRPKPTLNASQRLLVLQYLRSPLARELMDAANGSVARITRMTLQQLPLPRLDEALSAALADLAEAAKSFDAWRAEADAVLRSAFPENEDFEVARARLVEHGRTSRLRLEAASNLADYGFIVRTRFPYPVAYRWRTVEAGRSAGASRDAYDAVLETAEVLLCYTAHLSLVLARDVGVEIGYVATVRGTLARGKGLGFGDWSSILTEVRDGRAFRNLPDGHPLNDLRSLLTSPEVAAARKRLNDRRNDESHLRTVDPTDLPDVFDSAFADLRTLLRAAEFLSDLVLIHVTAVRWDSIRREATVSYRELMGDHPVVPTRTLIYHEPGVEVDSLYMMDTRHRLHLLRPFLVGRICPVCRNWSTFHADGVDQGVVRLKSLEHGHTMEDASLSDTFRQVGLLARLLT